MPPVFKFAKLPSCFKVKPDNRDLNLTRRKPASLPEPGSLSETVRRVAPSPGTVTRTRPGRCAVTIRVRDSDGPSEEARAAGLAVPLRRRRPRASDSASPPPGRLRVTGGLRLGLGRQCIMTGHVTRSY